MRTWWAAQAGRMLPFWLPAYAPTLNLLERVWHFLKQTLACHRAWANPGELRALATLLLHQTTARFHTDDRPAIRLAHNFWQSA